MSGQLVRTRRTTRPDGPDGQQPPLRGCPSAVRRPSRHEIREVREALGAMFGQVDPNYGSLDESGVARRLLQDAPLDRAFNQKSHTTQQRYHVEGDVLLVNEKAQESDREKRQPKPDVPARIGDQECLQVVSARTAQRAPTVMEPAFWTSEREHESPPDIGGDSTSAPRFLSLRLFVVSARVQGSVSVFGAEQCVR